MTCRDLSIDHPLWQAMKNVWPQCLHAFETIVKYARVTNFLLFLPILWSRGDFHTHRPLSPLLIVVSLMPSRDPQLTFSTANARPSADQSKFEMSSSLLRWSPKIEVADVTPPAFLSQTGLSILDLVQATTLRPDLTLYGTSHVILDPSWRMCNR